MLSELESKKCDLVAPVGSVHQGSCLSILPSIPEKFDLILFSPPYANRFDYFEIFKIELAMANIVDSYSAVQEFRRTAMRSNLMVPTLDDSIQTIPSLQGIVELMNPKDATERKILVMLKNYFFDFKTLLNQLHTKLTSRKGEIIIVVGNSAYMDTLVPTDLIMADIAKDLGFLKSRSVSH